MSDYLSHLVVRQISPEVGVRPRIASRFAPSEHVPEEGVGFTVNTEEREVPGPTQRHAAPAARWNAVARALASHPEEGRTTVSPGTLSRDPGRASAPGPERTRMKEPSVAVPLVERSLTIEAPIEAPIEQRSTLESAPVHTQAPSPLHSTRGEGEAIEEVKALTPSSAPRAVVAARSIGKALSMGEAPLDHRGTPTERQVPVEPLASARTPASIKSPGSTSSSATVLEAAAREEVRVMPRREAARVREEAGPSGRASSEGIVSLQNPEASRGTESPGPTRGSALQLQAGREAAAPLPAALEGVLAPVVQVTIGRIEVRAVTAPTPAKPAPARAAPAMSLDEYLQRRNGGRR